MTKAFRAIIKYVKKELPAEAAAAFSLAVGIEMFAAPNHIVGGGVTGIATLLHYLFGLPIGTMSFVMNVPLLLIGFYKLGRMFIFRTLRTVVILSLVMDWCAVILPDYSGNPLLAALFGGVLMGVGMGLVLLRGSTTGGTDILVRLIRKKRPHMSFGTVILITDMAVIASAAIVYKSLETIMFGIVMEYCTTVVVDKIIGGYDARKLAIIVSARWEEISRRILDELGRGATVLDAMGAYTRQKTGMLFCVVDSRQLVLLKRIVRRIDPQAFVIVSTATEILGEGFKSIENE
jgi:uncharacterized membrane-anchored protein YitT (DUF2179 family)